MKKLRLVVILVDDPIVTSLSSEASEVLIFRDAENGDRLREILSGFCPDIVLLGSGALMEFGLVAPSASPYEQGLEHVPSSSHSPRALNRRLKATLFFLNKGLQNAEIAQQLKVSTRTVKGYLQQLFVIFEVSNRTELLGVALTSGVNIESFSDDARLGGTSNVPPGGQSAAKQGRDPESNQNSGFPSRLMASPHGIRRE